MRTNPMVKPRTSSGWAVTLTVISCVCLIVAVRLFTSQPSAWNSGLVFMVVAILLASGAAAIWLVQIRRTKIWISHAVQQWEHFAAIKKQLGVTTEVTVLDIQSTDPLGAWVTIRWDKFGHVQRAWIEALPDEIWRGSVLLISPDPAQIQMHGPWPEIYYLIAADYHAYASEAAIPYFTDPKYESTIRINTLKP
ncbi:hypothetical protein QO003_000847 [Arthrobacter silviterrae]|uniref:Uncharacterized protein n=1 Tax=Arthrobacter silviterrae TaxID=2026658 RepID=A0ABX0DD52_9MICC|nr:hypothetical protein [Arthrobacter silviterrae]MDQ0276544.1 hypothetical protein [Arthrobacter silviterrae]NGN84832.1 hypothetical protein [Arthrobacter silviterrae]